MILRHICSTCEHNTVCKHKEQYGKEIDKINELEEYITVANVFVDCQYFTRVMTQIKEPLGFKAMIDEHFSKK